LPVSEIEVFVTALSCHKMILSSKTRSKSKQLASMPDVFPDTPVAGRKQTALGCLLRGRM